MSHNDVVDLIRNGSDIAHRVLLSETPVDGRAITCAPLAELRAAPHIMSGRPIRVDRHVIIITKAGTGNHIVDGVERTLEPGRVLHVLPGQEQQWMKSQPFDGWMIAIEPFLCPPGLFDLAHPSPVVVLGPSIEVANALVTSLTNPDIFPAKEQERLRISIATVLLELIAVAHDSPEIPDDLANEYALIADFRRELEFHYIDTRSVADYAAMVGCSAKTLTRATNRLLGQTPKQIIDARVTYAAIRLLSNTEISINWIATKLGFSQQSNFAKFFGRQVKMTPVAYREAFRAGAAPGMGE